MFNFFGFGRNKPTPTPSQPFQAETAESAPSTRQHTDIQRELVRVVLKDTLRQHGIPAGWIGCEVTIMSRHGRSRNAAEELFIHLIVLKWNDALLHYAPALQQQLIEGLDRFEPTIDHSKYMISWRFAADCECPFTRMPEPQFWTDMQASSKPEGLGPVAASPVSAAAPVITPAPAPKPKFDLPPSSMDRLPSAFAPTEPSPLN